jgi:polyhydroxyalkanoate synthesis regulator phasin
VAKKKGKGRPSRADAVRSAVDQAVQSTFQATAEQAQVTRERAQELADELAGTAGRIRDMLDELRPPSADDVRAMRTRIDRLEARVAQLESAKASRRRTPATKPAASRAAAKPAAAKPAAAKPRSAGERSQRST